MNRKKGFNIHLVEDHNDVLELIYKEIGTKRLNTTGLTLLHFDSHPDLGIPANLKADDILNKHIVLDSLSIENWILPAVFAGYISQVIWVKPKWAEQIKTGIFDVAIGKIKTTGGIACDCSESYFLSDNTYFNNDDLIDKRQFQLYVCNFDKVASDIDPTLANLLTNNSRNLIVDIDLDFFSTCDPFKAMFESKEDYELYKRVYLINKVPNKFNENFQEEFKSYLKEKKINLEKIRAFLDSDQISEDVINCDLVSLKKIFIRDSLDIEILHEYGSSLDECQLPEHVSTNEEVCFMMDQMVQFLRIYMPRGGSLRPGCITIARSSLDDYCPVSQVDFIQEETLKRIREYFNKSNDINLINYFYKNF